ncbi:MAG: hypothetical protein MJY60_06845 [Bacteroidales bacterium]|nr:hypothetical protein [Bacteroidales bacterium]
MRRSAMIIAALLTLMQCNASAQTIRTLDKRDLVTKEWITEVSSNTRYLDHETIYNSDGRKIQETEYTKLGKVWTKKYEYDASGKISRELTYNEKGRLDSIRKFEYNEFGKKKSIYTYDARGKLVKVKVVEYTYREHAD